MKTNWFILTCVLLSFSLISAQEEDLSDLFEEQDIELGLEEVSGEENPLVSEKESTYKEPSNEDLEMFAETLKDEKKSALDELPSIDEEQSKEISLLFEKAAQNYRDILDNRPEAEYKSNVERVESNKGLLNSNRDKLATSQSDLRRIKLQYIKRFLILKNSYKQGNFTKETYEQELAKLAKSYEFKVHSLVDDVDFYKGEVNQTEDRLKALEELHRIHSIMHPEKIKKSEEKKKNKRPLTELEKMMKKVQSTGDLFEVKDVWEAPDRN